MYLFTRTGAYGIKALSIQYCYLIILMRLVPVLSQAVILIVDIGKSLLNTMTKLWILLLKTYP